LQAAGVVAPSAPAASDAPPAASNAADGSDIPQGAAASIENLRGLGARARQLLMPALAQGGGTKTGLLGRIKQGGNGGGPAEPTPRPAPPPPPPASAGASPNRYMERQEREVRPCRGGGLLDLEVPAY